MGGISRCHVPPAPHPFARLIPCRVQGKFNGAPSPLAKSGKPEADDEDKAMALEALMAAKLACSRDNPDACVMCSG